MTAWSACKAQAQTARWVGTKSGRQDHTPHKDGRSGHVKSLALMCTAVHPRARHIGQRRGYQLLCRLEGQTTWVPWALQLVVGGCPQAWLVTLTPWWQQRDPTAHPAQPRPAQHSGCCPTHLLLLGRKPRHLGEALHAREVRIHTNWRSSCRREGAGCTSSDRHAWLAWPRRPAHTHLRLSRHAVVVVHGEVPC